MNYEQLPNRCKNVLGKSCGVATSSEFDEWAKSATLSDITGVSSAGSLTVRLICDAIKDRTGRDILAGRRLGRTPTLGLRSYPNHQGYVYAMRSDRMNAFKVGFSTDPKSRSVQVRTYVPDVVIFFEAYASGEAEMLAHKYLSEFCIGGEWYDCDGSLVREIIQKAVSEVAL